MLSWDKSPWKRKRGMLVGPEPAITSPPQPRPPSTSHPAPEGRNQSAVAQEELGSLRWPQDAQPWDLGILDLQTKCLGARKHL